MKKVQLLQIPLILGFLFLASYESLPDSASVETSKETVKVEKQETNKTKPVTAITTFDAKGIEKDDIEFMMYTFISNLANLHFAKYECT